MWYIQAAGLQTKPRCLYLNVVVGLEVEADAEGEAADGAGLAAMVEQVVGVEPSLS